MEEKEQILCYVAHNFNAIIFHKLGLLSMKHTVKNYFYSLKLVIRHYPVSFFSDLLLDIIQRITIFFSFTYLLRYVVNGIQDHKSVADIMTYVIVMLAVNVAFVIVNSTYTRRFKPILDKKGDARLKRAVFRRSLEADYANFDDPDAYESFSRVLSNSAEALECAKNAVQEMFSFALSFSLNVWLILTIDPVLFVFAALSLLSVLFTPFLNRGIYGYSVEEDRISRKNDYIRRTFYQAEFAKEMRLTNIHRVMIARFEASSAEIIQLLKTKRLRLAFLSFLDHFLTSCIVPCAAQLYAIYRTVVSKTMMLGDCLVVINAALAFSGIAASVKVIVSFFCDAALYIRDYRSFMTEVPQVDPNPDGLMPTVGDIELKNVSFRYRGAETDTLRGVSVKIKKGERIAIVGHNGVGKTTLVKLLLRLYDPTDGSVFAGGHDIREYRLKEYRRTYGVVFQDYRQMAMTVAENVLGRAFEDGDEAVVVDALKKAGLWEIISALPKGIHTVMTREFDSDGLVLSGGQTQKLAIASIYAKHADTVILDEPSSALDPLAEHEMYGNMLRASEGKTVIFISHRLSSAVSADRVFFMENGGVCEMGSHAELMRRNGKYAEMFRMQAQNYTDGVHGGADSEAM